MELLDEKQVAKLLRVSLASVRRWRQHKAGPTYIKAVQECLKVFAGLLAQIEQARPQRSR
ncbi:MAG TPA: hypothetical protein VFL31_00205 [Nitrospiraceae bacterium]|nr:hypothetical protein [Nitrospiraceae bacterium]